MKCGYSEELLALYVEGDLSQPESVDLGKHLVECERCARLVTELMESHALLKSLGQETVGSGVVSAVHQRVMNQVGVHATSGMWLTLERAVFGFRWRYALAGLILVVFALPIVWQLREEPVQVATTTAPPPVSAPLVETAPPVPAPVPVKQIVRREPAPEPTPEEVVAEEPREVLVKLYTDDPNVIIYWLVDQNGGSE